MNRKTAMDILRSRLFEAQIVKQQEKTTMMRKLQIGGANRCSSCLCYYQAFSLRLFEYLRRRLACRNEKVRTYNFPQGRVTDHRVKLTTSNLDAFMRGGDELIDFLDQLMQYESKEQLMTLIDSIQNKDPV